MSDSRKLSYIDLGERPYGEVLKMQEDLRGERLAGKRGDLVIFCSHSPVYTIGKQDCVEDFLASQDQIKKEGIEVFKCERGGRITYHGPGQLVIYFILDIKNYSPGVKEFVRRIEDVSIDALSSLGLETLRNEKYPGIWLGEKKVVAVGFNIVRNISMHGIAINVDPDMKHYKYIVPCGIKDMGVTSLREAAGEKCPGMRETKAAFTSSLGKILNCKMAAMSSLQKR